jgi:hypothetical protein
MSALIPFHGTAAALATGGRPDIRAMVKHFTQPYSAAVPFADLIETVRRNGTPARRSRNQRPSAAIEIHNVVAGHIDAVSKAVESLSVVLLAPDEADVREILGAMMLAFHAPPTPTSGFFIDALVMELQEPGDPISSPAIAAAAREMWQTLPAPPSISEFLTCVKKHQKRIEAVFKQLGDIIEASEWADDLIEPDKPVVWDEDDPNHIPF